MAFISCFGLIVSLLWGFSAKSLMSCSASQIMLGSKLIAGANQAWISANRTFAFGFTPNESKDLFYLSIWYNELPGDRVEVWTANRNCPVRKDATMELDTTGNLLLSERGAAVWSSNTSARGVAGGHISDSGNLILHSSDSHPIWQSFSHPSHTLLPNQPFNVSLQLSSSQPSNHLGFYTLKMLQQPNSLSLGLTFNSLQSDYPLPETGRNYSYWSVPEISNVTGEVYAVLDEKGSFGIVYGGGSGGVVYVHKNDESSKVFDEMPVLRRLTLEANGNLRLYRWDDDVNGSQQWVAEWAAVSNPCGIAGVCGSGVCRLKGSKSSSSCSCLPGTSQGHGSDDSDGGCLGINTSLVGGCDGDRRRLTARLRIAMVNLTNYYYGESSVIANYSDVATTAKCGDACLGDCNCVASVYGLKEEKAYCWILRRLEFGGFEDPTSTLFVKVWDDGSSAAPEGDSGGSGGGDHHEKTLILPIVLCMSVLIGLLCFLLYYTLHGKKALKNAIKGSIMVSGAPVNFSYRDLQSATSNFSHLLGTGGFGSVYKGNMGDGALIAVKKLERFLPHGEKEFITEVNTIGSMHHMNLVQLCGFCSEERHRLLVYEYMQNGSLDKWIFPSYNSHEFQDKLLDWRTRFNIAIATAQGIAYFHEQCRNRVIHCDIKPENILLDENFCPKVSDFGLAKLMGREHSQVVTMVRGTRGYLAPEWVSNRPITVKADVYSYGMLLLEIIGGRRNLDMSLNAADFFYPGWAFKEMSNGTPMKVADKRLMGMVEEDELIRALKVALWCIQDEIFMRPTMGEAVKMLEGSVEINPPPMPQTVLELIEEGLDHVYRAMKREFTHCDPTHATAYSYYSLTTHPSSNATCSYSTMSPR